jgi:hypothetical protein
MTPQIPTHDQRLWISQDTTVTEVVDYVRSRLAEPSTMNGKTVWNFHARDLDARALVNADLDDGHYVVPYQASGAWGWMVEIIPQEIAEAPVLVYRGDEGTYEVFDNFRAADVDHAALRATHEEFVHEHHGGEL